MGDTLRRIGQDLRRRRNVEVYVAASLAIILAILSIIGDVVPENLRWAVLLAGLALLVYRLTVPDSDVGIDSLLQDRSSYEHLPLTQRLAQADEVWIYGPSAINILSQQNCDALRRNLLSKDSGRVRVAVLNPEAQDAIALAERQLDGSVDYPLQTLRPSLNESIQRLALMASWQVAGKIEYRFVDYNPGFSMIAINPNRHDGSVIVELHGFHNETTDSRMHFELKSSQGSRWYAYWVDQFKGIWDSSKAPASAR